MDPETKKALEEIRAAINETVKIMNAIENNIRHDMNKLAERIAKLEAK